MTKKLRFGVFKRDGFQCQYCGKKPPEIVLEVDHINPLSKNGTDDIDNLITACFACNRGKGSESLQTIPTTVTDKLQIAQEREEQLKAYNRFLMQKENRIKKDIEELNSTFSSLFPGKEFSDGFKISIKKFLEYLPKQKLLDHLSLAYLRLPDEPEQALKYFCGINWREIRNDGRNINVK